MSGRGKERHTLGYTLRREVIGYCCKLRQAIKRARGTDGQGLLGWDCWAGTSILQDRGNEKDKAAKELGSDSKRVSL